MWYRNIRLGRFRLVVLVLAAFWNVTTAVAQQVTGVLGSPSATTTLSGKQLPPPTSEIRGRD